MRMDAIFDFKLVIHSLISFQRALTEQDKASSIN